MLVPLTNIYKSSVKSVDKRGLVIDCQSAIMTLYPNTLAFQQKAASCCQSLKSVLGYQQGVAFFQLLESTTMNSDDNKELTQKRFDEYLKYATGILFLAFVGSLISSALLDTLGYKNTEINKMLGFNSLYALWGVWSVILHFYLLNTKPIEYPQHKETAWEARLRHAGELCSYAFFGFLGTIGSLVVLGMLLQGILAIDITEARYTYRLILLTWGGWIVGLHLYYKHQEKTNQAL